MVKGGLTKNNKSHANYLFTPKWRLGKTTAIRIPEVLKDKVMEVARYLDNKLKIEVKNINFVEVLEENNNLKIEVYNLRNENQKLQQQLDNLSEVTKNQNSSNYENNQVNKYQLAVECFREYLESQNQNMEELSKARKGTKKHQLWLINNWFDTHSRNV